METSIQIFKTFLDTAFDNGDYSTDDVIAFVLPLFEEVLSFHETDLVAPFANEEALFITDNRLDIDEKLAHKKLQSLSKISELFSKLQSDNFNVVENLKLDTDVDAGTHSVENLHIHLKVNEPLKHPAFIPGYQCYEILVGHHDELSDIFSLGLVLGSIALGLNLYDEEDLKLFATYRNNPVQYNNRIHPAISGLITEMTELDRNKRLADLYEIIQRLYHYRDYDPEKQTDLSNIAGWVNKELTSRSLFILSKLRNRLFDTSRRNRLLYYKRNMRFVNLTVSSVPMVLHYQSIRADLLFTWNKEIASKVAGMKDILLNKYLRFEDHLYLSSSLDKIRSEAQHDKNEFGFSQLKLVTAFLNWHNLKENKHERIQSPLLLVPVELKKNKKLKEDHFVVNILDDVAEVNPVLANYLRELYGIKLPDFVDLNEMSMEQFYQLLNTQIEGAKQGISLSYIDKPRIKLIHSVARQTVSNYKRRLNRNNRLSSYKDINYSYETEHYKPLGLEIFRQRIEPRSAFLEFLVNDDIKIASNNLTGDAVVKERQLFELADSESNPYSWEFDVCNMVLGNFNYKKMSLVRDYNHVIDNKVEHTVFEKLFSNQPKQHKHHSFDLNKPDDWYHIITADPTQTRAILQGRTGESYIIQGPPGTGKSQTITNLIADFIARGKSILFVCEKRAALDVVFHRLKQQNLDELCCYIHDSQSDKKEFIKNLKTTYEDFSKNRMDLKDIKFKRSLLIQQVNEQLEILRIFHDTNASIHTESGLEVRRLIERIVEIKNNIVSLPPQQEELLPHYKDWLQFGDTIKQLSKALEETGADEVFAEHPFSQVNDSLFVSENPYNTIESSVKEIQRLLNNIIESVEEKNLAKEQFETFEQIKNIIQDAVLLLPLAETGNLQLVNSDNKEAKAFDKKIRSLGQQQKKYEQAKEVTKNWKTKFSEQDTQAALSIAQKNEKSFFSFLSGGWRRLKKQLVDSYDFSAHHVKPDYSNVLQQLLQEYNAANIAANELSQLQQEYKIDNIELTHLSIETLRSKRGDKEIDYLLQHPDADKLVIQLNKLHLTLQQLETQLRKCLSQYESKNINTLKDELENILANMDGLRELLPALREYTILPAHIKKALCSIAISPSQAEASMANKSLQYLYSQNKQFAGIDIISLEKAVHNIQHAYKQLLKLNAAHIRATVRDRFLQNVELSNMALSQLSAEQKTFKKNYNEGRKILENEFGKSMRYKSIRELSAKESQLVLKDLKPVWLMSPLSVSDSLPLDINYFDIIIFDEASQITLEEGIPALYRAPQTVIVGDDKQMPPTNFFSAKAEDPDDINTYSDETEDEILTNDADSLLIQGSKKLDNVMLGWHYRSRYETLISYSNHAFYDAGLLTIPDKTIHHTDKNKIEVTKAEDAIQSADALFNRSISFHFHPNSIYEKRNNQDEANYIAHLVRELLKRKIKDSIGIVAFSQEQQHTIEDALTALAVTDKEFEQLLEEAYGRTEEDQFVGLFVKNLENVQGDERDIIIMSVCYGFDSRKKMIMNFGPINKKGGEKRLNVIFSRAKKHMAIISSIQHFNITNEYNEGANYFKRFLHYAELVSNGNMIMARTVLDSLVLSKNKQQLSSANSSVVLSQIKEQLEKAGFEVTQQLGQSDFKCSLAVKAQKNDEVYSLSILLDDDKHYNNNNLLEQYYQRPAILKSFGWRMIFVSSKDWLHQPQKTFELILKRIKEEHVFTEAANEIQIETFTQQTEIPGNIEEEKKKSASLIDYGHLNFQQLVFADGGSNKFWEAATDNNKLIVRFGRTGTKGQIQVKTFAENSLAEKEKEKMIREKTAKGYKPKN